MAEDNIEYEFENVEEEEVESDEGDEDAKAFRTKWVGVANATSQSFMVQLNVDSSVSGRVAGND